jgi:hypothetical protein
LDIKQAKHVQYSDSATPAGLCWKLAHTNAICLLCCHPTATETLFQGLFLSSLQGFVQLGAFAAPFRTIGDAKENALDGKMEMNQPLVRILIGLYP